jgi:hypothetical protein
MARSIAAVIAGLVVTAVLVMVSTFLAGSLTGIAPAEPPNTTYLLLNLLGSALAGAVGGAVAVRVAAHTPHGHVIALAVVVLVVSIPAIFSAPAPGQPAWYPLALSALVPAAVLAGGLAAARRQLFRG